MYILLNQIDVHFVQSNTFTFGYSQMHVHFVYRQIHVHFV